MYNGRCVEKTELAWTLVHSTDYTMQLTSYIIQELDFERMQDMAIGEQKDWLEGMSYAEFVAWNVKCINQLSDEDDAWLVGLCKRMKDDRIILQDMEACCQFTADGFFFDYDKRIIIVNPR